MTYRIPGRRTLETARGIVPRAVFNDFAKWRRAKTAEARRSFPKTFRAAGRRFKRAEAAEYKRQISSPQSWEDESLPMNVRVELWQEEEKRKARQAGRCIPRNPGPPPFITYPSPPPAHPAKRW